MKENKFRAWNIKKKIMCYDNEDNSAELWDGAFSSEVGMINFHLNLSGKMKSYEYMQYTGCTDKNRKEIYEGDIFKHKDSFGIIEYREDGFKLKWIVNKEFANDILRRWKEDIEVIGNIYENPELMGGNTK